MAVCEDMGVFLEGLTIVTMGTDCFIGQLPDRPSECCALIEYAGELPLRNQTEGAARSGAQTGERPRIQVICRSETYSAGRSLIQSIWDAIDGIVNQTINGTWYVRGAALQSPFLLEFDDNRRWIFAVNFSFTKNV